MTHPIRWALLLALALAAVVAAFGYREAVSDPIVRVARIRVTGIEKPLRLLFVSDVHVQSPEMPPGRLGRILAELNRLHPDLVVLGGDYTGNTFLESRPSAAEAVAPFASLHPPLGVVAVLGNHEEGEEAAFRRALAEIGVRVLEDDAQQVGPISIGGIWQRPRHTFRRLLQLPGPRILVSHRPDPVEEMPAGIDLMLAGHTHCGQVTLPFVGALLTGSRIPKKLTCGYTRFAGKSLIVTAGLGTSRLPLRLGAPPDAWLIILQPARTPDSRAIRH